MTLLDLLPYFIHPKVRRRKKRKKPPSSKQRIPALRQKLWSEHPFCHYCQRRIGKGKGTIDHVIPASRRKKGRNRKRNLVLCCASCNESKGNLTLREWAVKISQAYFRTLQEGRPA